MWYRSTLQTGGHRRPRKTDAHAASLSGRVARTATTIPGAPARPAPRATRCRARAWRLRAVLVHCELPVLSTVPGRAPRAGGPPRAKSLRWPPPGAGTSGARRRPPRGTPRDAWRRCTACRAAPARTERAPVSPPACAEPIVPACAEPTVIRNLGRRRTPTSRNRRALPQPTKPAYGRCSDGTFGTASRAAQSAAMRDQDQYAATMPMTYSAGVRARSKRRCEIGRRTSAQATRTVISWPISTPMLNVSSATGR
jgi:hypothetical protein